MADIETIETELMLADLESLEKRVGALEKKARSGDKEASGRVQTLKPRLNARQRELAEAEVNTTKQQAKVKTTSTQDMN